MSEEVERKKSKLKTISNKSICKKIVSQNASQLIRRTIQQL